jgi:hypothetical protein
MLKIYKGKFALLFPIENPLTLVAPDAIVSPEVMTSR